MYLQSHQLNESYLDIYLETRAGNRMRVVVDIAQDASNSPEIRIYAENDDEPCKRLDLDVEAAVASLIAMKGTFTQLTTDLPETR